MIDIKKLAIVFVVMQCIVATLVVAERTNPPMRQAIIQASDANIAEQKALELIEANPILKRARDSSIFVGVGTVIDVGYGNRDEAAILVELPLSDNLKKAQIITVWYRGNVIVDYAYSPEDKIALPDILHLEKDMRVMFFVADEKNALYPYILGNITYIPYTIETMNSISQVDGEVALLSETQPSNAVFEADGYGFNWNLSRRRTWNDFPVRFNIDPDGTSDCTGEFDAVRAAFNTWENDIFSGIDFTDNGTGINYSVNDFLGQNPPHWEGMEVATWLTTADDFVAACFINNNTNTHINETDIVLQDRLTWCIGAQAGMFDVQSVATHEIGHMVGLQDLYDGTNSAQTMYHSGSRNDISLRSLEWGDENGAHYVYPVHNDANSGGDGSNTFSGAGSIAKNIWYKGRLCDLPTPDHTLDTQDYYKFYAGSSARLAFTLFPPSNADFDLELYDPDGNLVDYSRNRGDGVSETIAREGMGKTGYWRIRVYRYTTGGKGGNGRYQFKYQDMPLK